jgi:DNA-directed RNA polymerase subunit RPC12/RpoP
VCLLYRYIIFKHNLFLKLIGVVEATCQHRISIFSSSTERSREPKPQYCSSRALYILRVKPFRDYRYPSLPRVEVFSRDYRAREHAPSPTAAASPANIIGLEATYMESAVAIS